MVRKLAKLRIDEVSSVDRGAGEGCKVVFWKRDDPPQRRTLRRWFDSVDYAKLAEQIAPRDDDITDDDDDATLPDKLEQYVAAMITAVPTLSREHAVHFLLHTAAGRKLAEHLNSISKTERAPPMNRTDELRDIAKAAGGMSMICKNIIDHGTTTITEAEFSAALMEHAKSNRRGDESVVKAFSRMIEEEPDIRRAYGIAKGYPDLMSLEPTMVGGDDATDVNNASKAYQQLTELAEEQRRRSPTLTVAQAFARVFEDNPELAAKAHRRPQPTTSFAFPR